MSKKPELVTDEDALWGKDEDGFWDDDQPIDESESFQYQEDAPVRRLTPDDIAWPEGLGEIQIGYHISYSCKIILRNPYKEWSDREIKNAILSLNSNYIHQLSQFINVFRQVENLKSVWVSGYSIDETLSNNTKSLSPKVSRIPEIHRQIGNLFLELAQLMEDNND